jgi:hypothetical protein
MTTPTTPKPMNTIPIYTSNCTKKSLWQKYEIFEDRVELHTWVGNFKIPFEQIEKVEVFPPALKSLRLHLKNCLPVAVHLDAINFKEHVILDKKKGIIRHILFTPEDPAEFKRAVDQALTRFRDNASGPKTPN